jgi:hypothetical protein
VKGRNDVTCSMIVPILQGSFGCVAQASPPWKRAWRCIGFAMTESYSPGAPERISSHEKYGSHLPPPTSVGRAVSQCLILLEEGLPMADGPQHAPAGTTLTPPSHRPHASSIFHTGSGDEPDVLASGAWEPDHGRNEHPAHALRSLGTGSLSP